MIERPHVESARTTQSLAQMLLAEWFHRFHESVFEPSAEQSTLRTVRFAPPPSPPINSVLSPHYSVLPIRAPPDASLFCLRGDQSAACMKSPARRFRHSPRRLLPPAPSAGCRFWLRDRNALFQNQKSRPCRSNRSRLR